MTRYHTLSAAERAARLFRQNACNNLWRVWPCRYHGEDYYVVEKWDANDECFLGYL